MKIYKFIKKRRELVVIGGFCLVISSTYQQNFKNLYINKLEINIQKNKLKKTNKI